MAGKEVAVLSFHLLALAVQVPTPMRTEGASSITMYLEDVTGGDALRFDALVYMRWLQHRLVTSDLYTQNCQLDSNATCKGPRSVLTYVPGALFGNCDVDSAMCAFSSETGGLISALRAGGSRADW
jgi:hypothetical protein